MRLKMLLFVVAIVLGFAAEYDHIALGLIAIMVLVWWLEVAATEEEFQILPQVVEVIRVYEMDDHIVADRIKVNVVCGGLVYRDLEAGYYYKMDYFFREGALAQSAKNKNVHLYSIENQFAQEVLTNSFVG